jgi:hypothetical protein
MRGKRALYPALAVLCLIGFMAAATPAAAGKGVETRLFFGASIPLEKQPCGGKYTSVNDEAWATFVATFIEKEYDGFTVEQAIGYWKGAQERSRVVTLVGDVPDDAKIGRIIAAYVDLFCQDAVLRVDKAMDFDFVAK